MSDAIWRETLAGIRKRIDDARDGLKAAEASVRAFKKAIKDDEAEHEKLYKAWILGVAEPPPRQAEMFAGDAPEPTVAPYLNMAGNPVYLNLPEATAAAHAELAEFAERSRAVREDLAIAAEPAPFFPQTAAVAEHMAAVDAAIAEHAAPPRPSWSTAWRHATPVALPDWPDTIYAKFTPATSMSQAHLEFEGPASDTGYYSHFFTPPCGWASRPTDYVDRLARHLCRTLAGKDVPEADDAPAWRGRPLVDLGLKASRITPLRKGGMKVVGDVWDAIELDCHVALSHCSKPGLEEVAWAVRSFIASATENPDPEPPKPRKPAKKPRKPVGAAKPPTATVEAPDEAARVGCHAEAPTPLARTWEILLGEDHDGAAKGFVLGEVCGTIDEANAAAAKTWPDRALTFKEKFPDGSHKLWAIYRAGRDDARGEFLGLVEAVEERSAVELGRSRWPFIHAIRAQLHPADAPPPKAAPRRKTKAEPAPRAQEAAL